MRESTNVKEFVGMLPEAHYILKVQGKPEKVPTGKSSYRDWNFITDDGRKLNIRMFPWESKGLLLAVGGKLDLKTESVDWDDDAVDGKEIEADLVHEEYPKKNGETGKKMVLRNIEPTIPF